MIQDYAELQPGQQISRHHYKIDEDLVAAYVAAVQDASHAPSDASGRRFVPAMAVAALSIRGVVEDLRIPGGTLHVGQEFEFSSPVRVGAKLDCVATLAQNSVRGDWRFLVVDCCVKSDADLDVMTGKSTIMVPAELGPRTDS